MSSPQACPVCRRPYGQDFAKAKGRDRALIAVVVVVCVALIALPILFFSIVMSGMMHPRPPEVERLSLDVLIADGGHYRLTVDWWVGESYRFNVTVTEGSAVDVYIMFGEQYRAAYESEDTPQSFACLASYENVTHISEVYEPTSSFGTLILVIDNRDFALTEHDAVPQGAVGAELEVELGYLSYPYYD
ncbi:MAG: hypothetical protein AB1665_08415 [Candidatus Thermoplasmatota archaeon]